MVVQSSAAVVKKAVKDSLRNRSTLDFSRSYRLVSKADFQSVFANPRKVTQKYLVALFRHNAKDHARLGMVVSKNRLKLAVDRNRFKRVVREQFRQHKDMLKGLDIVILLRSECTALDKNVLRDDINNLWRALANSSKPA